MNTKRFVIIFSLGLALVMTTIWMLSPTFNPARAYTDTIVTPSPTIDRVEVTRSRQNVPIKEYITDGQSQILSGITPLASSSAHIANGDFENGQDGSWIEYSSYGWDIIMNISNLPVTPHSGSWAAWLGGDYDYVSNLSQGVTIPAGASTLSYWYWIASEDVCGYDFGWVKINSTDMQIIDLCEDNDTNGWVEKTIDISAYTGQVITLQIRVETDDSLNSNFFVDDVTLDTESFTYLPITYRNYWAGYFDDFDDPNGGWPTGDNEYWKFGYLNGEYQYYLKKKDLELWITPGPITGRDLYLPDDYRVEVEARKVSSGDCGYGLIFGQGYESGSDGRYKAVVSPTSEEFYIEKEVWDGSSSTLIDWTYASAINQGGGTNHIAVQRVGSNIKLYINGTQVADITDSSFLGEGRDAGLVGWSWDDVPVEVRFDNFAATQK